jgi:hypothetical protein
LGREDEIRLIACNILKEQDCPDGQDFKHWLKAEVICEKQNRKPIVISSNSEFNQPVRQNPKIGVIKKNS